MGSMALEIASQSEISTPPSLSRYSRRKYSVPSRTYLDKEGGVDISDCEAISRAMDPILDEKDPIQGSYHFEVCSAGLERALKRPSDFERFMGSPITVKLYRPRNGLKELPCVLKGYEDGVLTVEAGKETITFTKSEVALVRLRVEF